MQNINQIETIFVLMFENRSFDHLMGYLSLPPFNRPVEGLGQCAGYTNEYNGFQYAPFHLSDPAQLFPDDPPHERPAIGTQLDPEGDESYSMRGFVRSYAQIRSINEADHPVVMGYYTADDLPATHFLAMNYGICDHYFAAIPTGTQPNRLLAMSGYTLNDVNQNLILPKQDLVYDWLTRNGISWRVYHQGIPFFMMMDEWHLKIVADDEHFRGYDDFQADWISSSPFPQVVFIEPRYTDAPHFEAPTDDHAPSPVTGGQNFLSLVYSDIITNWDRWQRTLLVVNYDENGGFFDHVKPLPIVTKEGPGAKFTYGPFRTTGPRVPAYLISPFVKPGSIYSGNLDHTSVLKCIARRFGKGSYSAEVETRPVGDLWDALELDAPRGDDADYPPPPNPAGFIPGTLPTNHLPQAFAAGAAKAKGLAPEATKAKFPELFSHFDNLGPTQ